MVERKLIGLDMKRLEFGWPIGMPLCEPMGDGLYQLRTNLPSNKIARVLFCVEEGGMYNLHAFIKKTPKTPKQDLDLARARRKDIIKTFSVKR